MAHAKVNGITINTTNASTNGPTSTTSASPAPMNQNNNSGKSSICAINSSGVAARSRWLLPPANPLNTIT